MTRPDFIQGEKMTHYALVTPVDVLVEMSAPAETAACCAVPCAFRSHRENLLRGRLCCHCCKASNTLYAGQESHAPSSHPSFALFYISNVNLISFTAIF